MNQTLQFILEFQRGLFTLPSIVFFLAILAFAKGDKNIQSNLVSGIIGALTPQIVSNTRSKASGTPK
jgi:hypothetical protein